MLKVFFKLYHSDILIIKNHIILFHYWIFFFPEHGWQFKNKSISQQYLFLKVWVQIAYTNFLSYENNRLLFGKRKCCNFLFCNVVTTIGGEKNIPDFWLRYCMWWETRHSKFMCVSLSLYIYIYIKKIIDTFRLICNHECSS